MPKRSTALSGRGLCDFSHAPSLPGDQRAARHGRACRNTDCSIKVILFWCCLFEGNDSPTRSNTKYSCQLPERQTPDRSALAPPLAALARDGTGGGRPSVPRSSLPRSNVPSPGRPGPPPSPPRRGLAAPPRLASHKGDPLPAKLVPCRTQQGDLQADKAGFTPFALKSAPTHPVSPPDPSAQQPASRPPCPALPAPTPAPRPGSPWKLRSFTGSGAGAPCPPPAPRAWLPAAAPPGPARPRGPPAPARPCPARAALRGRQRLRSAPPRPASPANHPRSRRARSVLSVSPSAAWARTAAAPRGEAAPSPPRCAGGTGPGPGPGEASGCPAPPATSLPTSSRPVSALGPRWVTATSPQLKCKSRHARLYRGLQQRGTACAPLVSRPRVGPCEAVPCWDWPRHGAEQLRHRWNSPALTSAPKKEQPVLRWRTSYSISAFSVQLAPRPLQTALKDRYVNLSRGSDNFHVTSCQVFCLNPDELSLPFSLWPKAPLPNSGEIPKSLWHRLW